MAAINGVNYQKSYVDVPSSRSNVGEVGGSIKCLVETYVALPAAADVLSIGYLPINARILSIVGFSGMGAAPTFAKIDSLGASTTLAVGDVLADASLIKVTAAGGTYAANVFGFITYVVV